MTCWKHRSRWAVMGVLGTIQISIRHTFERIGKDDMRCFEDILAVMVEYNLLRLACGRRMSIAKKLNEQVTQCGWYISICEQVSNTILSGCYYTILYTWRRFFQNLHVLFNTTTLVLHRNCIIFHCILCRYRIAIRIGSFILKLEGLFAGFSMFWTLLMRGNYTPDYDDSHRN